MIPTANRAIIKETWPPNIAEIKQHFDLEAHDRTFKPVFAYGDTIFNPHQIVIPPDVEYHEMVHLEQQKLFVSPDFWWLKYCLDSNFRQSQEVEAYAAQLVFIKKHIPKAYREALDELASHLSSPMYRLNLTKYQAETLIRKKVKQYAN